MKSTTVLKLLSLSVSLLLLIPACRKADMTKTGNANNQVSSSSEPIIRTPFGPMPASMVHKVESGYHLSFDASGHLQKIHTATGKMVEDFGVQRPVEGVGTSNHWGFQGGTDNGSQSAGQGVRAPLANGWITDAFWNNNTGLPITFFSTTWVVPGAPFGTDNELLYLFNGMQDGPPGHILQPVLQYGNNGIWGGYYWTINNWYASCQGCGAFYGNAANVNQGTTLQGIMTQTAQNGNNFSYNSSFAGFAGTNLQVNNVPPMVQAVETMEGYNMYSSADYPYYTNSCNMTAIQLQTGGVDAPLDWTPEDRIQDIGQHTVVVSNNSPGGEVDLFYRWPPPVITGLSELGAMPSGYVEVTWSYTPPTGLTLSSFNVSLTNYRTGANVQRTHVTPSLHLTVQPPTGTIRGDQVAVYITAVLSNNTNSYSSNVAVETMY